MSAPAPERGRAASPGIPAHLIARLVREALDEDLGPGDVTTDAVVSSEARARATISARQEMVVSGADVAVAVFRAASPAATVLSSAAEGETLPRGGMVLEIAGEARALLRAERTAMNFLAHLSGVATFTRSCVDAAGGGRTPVTDTRKTTPTLRLLEKRAVVSGGGSNHRFGLWDAVLIKDNHIEMAGDVARAVSLARDAVAGRMPVQTEVRSLAELDQALESGADAVLLDNFSPDTIEEAVRRASGKIILEVSGGVSRDDLPRLARLGVDRISMGSITHSAPSVDLTMRIEPWKS